MNKINMPKHWKKKLGISGDNAPASVPAPEGQQKKTSLKDIYGYYKKDHKEHEKKRRHPKRKPAPPAQPAAPAAPAAPA